MNALNSNSPANAANPASMTGIDCAKFVASILVIAIHTAPLSEISKNLNYCFVNGVSRLAVPFFLICSGYFYVRSADKKGWDQPVLWSFIRRIFIVYAMWSLIYLPLVIKSHWPINPEFFRKYIYDFFFLGSYFHFWYFPSLISSIVLMHFVVNRVRISGLLWMGVVLYLFCLLGDAYWKFSRFPGIDKAVDFWSYWFTQTRNLWPGSFLFVALGAYAARNSMVRSPIQTALLSFLFLIGYQIEVVATYYYKTSFDHNAGIFLPPAAYFAFLTALNWSPRLNFDSALLRNISIIVFCAHPLFLYFLRHIGFANVPNFVMFSGSMVMSIVLGYFAVKSHFKPVRLLY